MSIFARYGRVWPLAETPFLVQKQGFLYKSPVFHRCHAASIAKGGFYIKKEVAVEVDLDREVGLGAPLKTYILRNVRVYAKKYAYTYDDLYMTRCTCTSIAR